MNEIQITRKVEKFRVNVCYETSEHSMKTADENSKVTFKAFGHVQ